MSLYFSSTNRVNQGVMLSPIILSIYIDEMLITFCLSLFRCMSAHK